MVCKGGRPAANINADHLQNLLQHFPVARIANEGLLGERFHHNTVHKFMKRNGLKKVRARYSQISDTELLRIVTAISLEFPKSG